MQFHTKLIIRCPGQTAQPAFLLMNRYKGWRVSSGATLASLKVPVSQRLHSPVQSIFFFPLNHFPAIHSTSLLSSWTFARVNASDDLEKLRDNTDVLLKILSIMTSRLFHLYRCIKFVCLFIFQIKIHFRFVRHWLWLNRVTAAFSPNVSFLKKEQNWSFICCMMGDDLTRWTEAPPGLTALATISYHCGC